MGLVFAEAAMMALAKHIGRSEAHELIERASKQAIAENKHFREILKQNQEVRSHLSSEEIDRLFEPLTYIGVAEQLVDRAIAAYRLTLKRSEE